MYSGEIDDRVFTLAACDWAYKRAIVLCVKETEGLWSHLEGETGLTCISGELKGRKLAELPSVKARRNLWKAQHPDSKFLK